MSNETPLRGRPTLHIRGRRRLGSIICRRRGNRPVLTFPVLGRRAEERHGRAVICRRCLAPCGDTIPEVTR